MFPRLILDGPTLTRTWTHPWADPTSALHAGGGLIAPFDVVTHEVDALNAAGLPAAARGATVRVDARGWGIGPIGRRFGDLCDHLDALHEAGVALRQPRPAALHDGVRWRFVDYALAEVGGRGWPFATTDTAAEFAALAVSHARVDPVARVWARRITHDGADAAYEARFGRAPVRAAAPATWLHPLAAAGGLGVVAEALVRRRAREPEPHVRAAVARLVAAVGFTADPVSWRVLAEVLHLFDHPGATEAWRRGGGVGDPDFTGHAAWFDAGSLSDGQAAWPTLRRDGPAAALRRLGDGWDDWRVACAVRAQLAPREVDPAVLRWVDGDTLRWIAALHAIEGRPLQIPGPWWLQARVDAVQRGLPAVDPWPAPPRPVDPVVAAWLTGHTPTPDPDPARVAALAVLRGEAALAQRAAGERPRDHLLAASLQAAAGRDPARAWSLLHQAGAMAEE